MLAAATVLCVMAAGHAHPAGRADAGSAAKARRGGTLRLGARLVPAIDPAIAYLPGAWQIEYATCAKLFNYPDASGPAGTRLVPEVVDRFTVSKDGRTYTFTLKKTFRFHTGAPVTAQSFAYAFNRDANPTLNSDAAAYMREIVGAAAVMDGTAQSISGVRVLGRDRLQIRLTKPVGDFTARLTMPFFCPILAGTPLDPAGVDGIDDPAGSGPYHVAERVVNQRIVLKRIAYYHGTRPANVDEVVWTIETGDDCLVAVEEDRVDYCVAGIPATAYRTLAETYGINRPGGQFFVSPSLSMWYLVFNHDRPAFKGQRGIPLEKVINYAIDRPAMARPYGYLVGKRTDQMLPPVLARDERIYPLKGADPSTGRAWLARAKTRPRELVLYAFDYPESVEVAQVLAFDLKKLGIDLEVKYFDDATMGEKSRSAGNPSASPCRAGMPITPMRRRSSSQSSALGAQNSACTWTTRASIADWTQRTGSGARRADVPGPTSTSTSCATARTGLPTWPRRDARSSHVASGASSTSPSTASTSPRCARTR
jgi:ABC-type oligopeptide transport system substrate-binding subunit